MSRWHLVIRGRVVRSTDAPDKWAAERVLGPGGQVISDASWRITQEAPRRAERRCGCGREATPGMTTCSSCKNAYRRTARRVADG